MITLKILTRQQFDDTFTYCDAKDRNDVYGEEYLSQMYKKSMDELIKYGVVICEGMTIDVLNDLTVVGVVDRTDGALKLIKMTDFNGDRYTPCGIHTMNGIVFLARSMLSSSVITLNNN
jgi:hypothetical protein